MLHIKVIYLITTYERAERAERAELAVSSEATYMLHVLIIFSVRVAKCIIFKL